MHKAISPYALALSLLLSAQASAQVTVPKVAVPNVDGANVAQDVGKAAGVFSCPAEGSKQKIGAAVGGVVGGIAGNRVIKGKRVLGTIVGGAAGAALGSWIGCKLQIGDQRKAQKALEQAAANGQSQQWNNSETGAYGSATVVAGSTLNGLRFPPNVMPYSQYDGRSGIFVSNGRVNLRSLPTTSSDIVGTLHAGEQVEVVAGTLNAPWLLVAQNGVARGYVSAPLLVQNAATLQPGCRVIRQEIVLANGEKSTQDFKACPDNVSGWQLAQI
ncbi:SH3 domain-containing protein [uncultured Sphingorhabdus sp.]|uniref:SH3 domain-containing protein n=1 Tax=uncultured Sphingorhabdus sp. TaxID=1686106 RepID=UPI002607A45E|nr:SH3 domain-containing protein [uncultured Sphingorhabdus sp.]HMS20380.1 SH3 domain-containing protein [Sphingorhabdus sp.]